MKYTFSYVHAHRHCIDIELLVDGVDSDNLTFQLPAWRPGRYELGNFAKNIMQWKAYDDKGELLEFKKATKDSWQVKCSGAKWVKVKYTYYAAELNAGSTFLNEKQLYVNPVNCCLYIPDRMHLPHSIQLQVPADYKVATGLTKVDKHTYIAADFHELADSPFIASNSLQHNMFVMDGVEFNLWFQGDVKPNWPRLINDFFIFINDQFVMMQSLPKDVYHFFFQIVPYKFYHGVEHLNSTVIALGPASKVMSGEMYNELLGVSSHELFHVWNIKSIRPAEMHPYDYSKENYSRLGYVYEGVTTYYGDLILFRSGVFNEIEYLKTVNERLNKHFHNYARFTMPVADASFDTWLDGYIPGAPNRKTNIYDEGSILAFITDMLIRKHTKNAKSLDDVMLFLYNEFAKKGKGYTERDYRGIVEHIADTDLSDLFDNYINGTSDYESLLRECASFIGCELITTASKKFYEHSFGIKLAEPTGKIANIYPDSPSDKAGLAPGDELLAVNGVRVGGDINEWHPLFENKVVDLTVVSGGYTKQVLIRAGSQTFYPNYYIVKSCNASDEQKAFFKQWSKHLF